MNRRPSQEMLARIGRMFEKGLIQPWRSRRQATIRGAPSRIAIKEETEAKISSRLLGAKAGPRLQLQTVKQESTLQIRFSRYQPRWRGRVLPLSRQRWPLGICTQPQPLL